MKSETTLSKMISTAGEKAAYDNACKRLLSNKETLAWIMKSCLSEYRDCSIQQIAYEYIEGEPQISQVAVHRDESIEIPTIKGENIEKIQLIDILFEKKNYLEMSLKNYLHMIL